MKLASNSIKESNHDREAFEARQEEKRKQEEEVRALEQQKNLREGLRSRKNYYELSFFHWVFLGLLSLSLFLFSALLVMSYIPSTKFIVQHFFDNIL